LQSKKVADLIVCAPGNGAGDARAADVVYGTTDWLIA